MNVDQFKPTCRTCKFAHRNVASYTGLKRIGCGHVDHELQSDAVRFTDDAFKYRKPSSTCGIHILTSTGDFTPGYWPNRREATRLTVPCVIEAIVRAIKILSGNELEGHRF